MFGSRWKSKTMEIVAVQSKVKEVVGELNGGSSRGHLGVNKTLHKVRQQQFCLHARKNGANNVSTVQQDEVPKLGARA